MIQQNPASRTKKGDNSDDAQVVMGVNLEVGQLTPIHHGGVSFLK